MTREQEVRCWYRHYNRKYFGGKLPVIDLAFKLPRNARVRSDGLVPRHPWKKAYAYTLFDQETTKPFGIFFEPRTKIEAHFHLLLLHEMVHVELGHLRWKHGKRFQNEMLRLAKAGAFKDCW
jgi:hypothetical protein